IKSITSADFADDKAGNNSRGGLPGPVPGLELRWRQVVAGAVEAPGVVPVDPPESGQLDVVDAPPGALAADQLGLVKAVDRLGQGVVTRVALGAHRIHRSLRLEPIGVADRQVLAASVGVVDEALEDILLAAPDRHLQVSRWEDPSPVDADDVGRRTRSSRRTGKPSTRRR